jgi:hypothetical protein
MVKASERMECHERFPEVFRSADPADYVFIRQPKRRASRMSEHFEAVERDAQGRQGGEGADASHIAVEIPQELSVSQAAKVLGVDRKTVLKYLGGGLLEWRDIAPPGSTRPTYRMKRESVIAIRTTYRATGPSVRTRRKPVRRPASCASLPVFKHLDLN